MRFSTGLRHSRSGFTLIELLVGMTVFILGITAIFLMLDQTMRSANISKSEVIVANLLREQIELVRNVRDTNLTQYAPWDRVPIDSDFSMPTALATPFFIENNYAVTSTTYDEETMTSPVRMIPILDMDMDHVNDMNNQELLQKKFDQTQLSLDNHGRYVHEKTDTPTQFASYMIVSPLAFMRDGTTISVKNREERYGGYILDARVIVRDGSRYREYDAKSVITDWIQ